MSKAKKTTRTNATTKTKAPKGLIFIDANGVEHAPDSEEALERLLPQRPSNETTAVDITVETPSEAAPKGKGKRKGATETPARAPATQASEPVSPPTDDSEEVCVFAIRLRRAERDLIHSVAGSGKATRFVKTVALAAARGDIDTIHGIVAEVVDGKHR